MDNTEYDRTFTDIKPDILYYAQEGFGYSTHPLTDIFFVTARKELVLVDVTGGKISQVEFKRDRMNQWINSQQKDIHDHEVHGVILAPLASGNSDDSRVLSVKFGDTVQHFRVMVARCCQKVLLICGKIHVSKSTSCVSGT